MTKKQLLFRKVRIIDPKSSHNGQQTDVLVQNGKIASIGKNLSLGEAYEIQGKGLNISPGLFDMQTSCGEPGFEEKETFRSLNDAALAGGITDLLVMPASNPVTDNRGQVEYLKKITAELPVMVHVAGALSEGMKGVNLAELFDMRQGGAIAFTDDKSPLENSVLLHLALQYSKVSGGLIMVHNEESKMRLGGKVNEGEVSTRLGMKGAPALSEELGLVRNISLARYHQIPLHLNGISTAGSVQLVREAKASGLKISCSVYAHHLYLNDSVLETFNADYKVWPPLRTETDRLALIDGLKDGTIDVICSDHRPENREKKDVEFDFAAYGMIGLESLFGASFHALGSAEMLIEKMAYAPRQILGLETPAIEEHEKARFFVYNDEPYIFDQSHIRGKSSNTPFRGKSLKGRIIGTYTYTGGWKVH